MLYVFYRVPSSLIEYKIMFTQYSSWLSLAFSPLNRPIFTATVTVFFIFLFT